jgi:hypothetical protein
MRFKVIETHVQDEQGRVTGTRYRIIDTRNPDQVSPSKHGVYNDHKAAVDVCEKLNSDKSYATE